MTQRDVICTALRHAFSTDECTFVEPEGGMFVWLEFNPNFLNVDSMEVFKVLAEVGVIVVPGKDFKVPLIVEEMNSTDKLVLRLSYAASSPELIIEGVNRLSAGIRKAKQILS